MMREMSPFDKCTPSLYSKKNPKDTGEDMRRSTSPNLRPAFYFVGRYPRSPDEDAMAMAAMSEEAVQAHLRDYI